MREKEIKRVFLISFIQTAVLLRIEPWARARLSETNTCSGWGQTQEGVTLSKKQLTLLTWSPAYLDHHATSQAASPLRSALH